MDVTGHPAGADLAEGRAWDDCPAVEEHPLVAAAGRLADDVLSPRAAQVDRGVVPRSHLTGARRFPPPPPGCSATGPG